MAPLGPMILDDGTKIFPPNIPPPIEVEEDYVVDRGNPYVHRLTYPPCPHRECSMRPCARTGRLIETYGCKKFEIVPLNMLTCHRCPKENRR